MEVRTRGGRVLVSGADSVHIFLFTCTHLPRYLRPPCNIIGLPPFCLPFSVPYVRPHDNRCVIILQNRVAFLRVVCRYFHYGAKNYFVPFAFFNRVRCLLDVVYPTFVTVSPSVVAFTCDTVSISTVSIYLIVT